MSIPNDLRYTKDHEWGKLLRDKTISVGITDHAQSSLGDVVFVELPAIGRTLKAGEAFGVVESIKAVSELYSPVDGKVVATNAAVTGEPAVLNRAPYSDGWLIEIELSQPAQMETLLTAAQYKDLVSSSS